ncbi:MAG: hemolysin family protein [Spirochaetia bacterium]|jgi:putative hemolysin|nr:hemolysin family protein [Spirochaetia bacterium]
MLFEIILIIILLFLSGVFSATETAYTSLSVVQIQELAPDYDKKGKMVKFLSKRPDILLSTILIVNNLVNIAASSIVANVTIQTYGSQGLAISTGLLTLVVLIFAEVTPKQIAIVHNEKIALFMAYPVRWVSWILLPVIKFIGFISSLITHLVGGEKKKLSLEGILYMVSIAEGQGVVETYETRMIKNVFRFNDTLVQAIMTHRTEVFSLNKNTSIGDALVKISEKGYSRIPVYNNDPEEINGIVLVKNLMANYHAGKSNLKLKDIMLKPLYISGTRKVNELFYTLKNQKLNIAIVKDEYGGLAGIVTMEDITEELFGELYDEHEKHERDKISALRDGSYRVMGETTIHQIEDRLGLELPTGKYAQTLAGYLVEYLGNIPVKNQRIETPFGVFQIESIKRNRINSVILNMTNR